jgi:hypothetical protein
MVKYGTYTLDAPPPFQGTWRAIVDRLHYHFKFVRLCILHSPAADSSQLLGCGDCREIILKPDAEAYVFSSCRHHKGFYDGFCPFAATRYAFDDGRMHATRIPPMPIIVEDPRLEKKAEASEAKRAGEKGQMERPESLVIPFRASPEPMSTADHLHLAHHLDPYVARGPADPRTKVVASVQRTAVRMSIDGTEASAYSQLTTVQTIPTDDLKPDSASRPYSPFSDSHEPILHKDTKGTAAFIDPFPFAQRSPGVEPDAPADTKGTEDPLPFPFVVKPPSSEATRHHTPELHAPQAIQPSSLLHPPSPPPELLQPASVPPALALLQASTQEAAQAAGALGTLRETLTNLETQLLGAVDTTRALENTVGAQASTIAGMAQELEGMRARMQRLRTERGKLLEFRTMMFEAFGLHDPETWDADD